MSFFFLNHQEHRNLRPHMLTALTLVCLVVWAAIWQLEPSPHLVSDANLKAAQTDLTQITREKHPVGSEAHQRVREYLVARLSKLGLSVEQQTEFALNPRSHSAAQVHNLMVRIPATSAVSSGPVAVNKKTILVAAHYDSVANSFGAGDDGVSVANMLQVIELLQHQTPRLNDVIFLITDAEETGLLGAIAFAERHAWSKEVALVLNFDNRGNSGPIMMFETSKGNGKLIEHLARAAPHVVSNSIMYEVYKALPNDTDFTVFRERGIAGLNFAMIGNFSSYHTHHDTAKELSPGSLAQQQRWMRELVLHFSQQDLNKLEQENDVYFSLPVLGLIHYSNTTASILSVCIGLGLFLTFWWQRRRSTQEGASPTTSRLHFVALAALLFALQLALFDFLGQRAWIFICRLYPEYANLRDADNGHFYLLAFILFFATVFTYLQTWFCRWWRAQELQFGIYLIWLLLLATTTVMAPGLSFLFAWPLALACLAQTLQPTTSPVIGFWLHILGLLPSVLLFAPLILLFNIALGMRMSGVPIVLSVLLVGLAHPVIMTIATQLRRWIPLLFVKALIVLAAITTANYHREFPEPTQLFYVAGAQANQSYWASPNEKLSPELFALFGERLEYKLMEDVFGKHSRYGKMMMWRAATSEQSLAKPIIEVQQIRILDRHLLLQVKVSSPAYANSSFFTVEGSKVLKARINGQDYVAADPDHWSLLVHGRNTPDASLGNVLELEIEAGKATQLKVIDTSYRRLPELKVSSDFAMMSIANLDIH